MDVGIRELRDGLSRHLDEVRSGKTVTVTDHGRPIARIIPYGPTTLELLIAEGKATPGRKPRRPLPPPIEANGTISDLIDEQRR